MRYLQNYTSRDGRPIYASEAMYEYLQKKIDDAMVFKTNNSLDTTLNTILLNLCSSIQDMAGTRIATDIFEKFKEANK